MLRPGDRSHDSGPADPRTDQELRLNPSAWLFLSVP